MDEREELENSCLSVGGFCQPQPYIHLHRFLGTSDDGFLDRISTCIIDSIILKEKEVEEWNNKLDAFGIADFTGKCVELLHEILYFILLQSLSRFMNYILLVCLHAALSTFIVELQRFCKNILYLLEYELQ
jgi:hypothetical protein